MAMKMTIKKFRMKNYILLMLVIILISFLNFTLFPQPMMSPSQPLTSPPQPLTSPSQECFERFRKLSPEKDGVNTLGRYTYFL
jgi:hypothetical protein